MIETASLMLGRSAPPEVLSQLTFLSSNHHRLIKEVDTVRAFRVGVNYIVEVDVVLDKAMDLKQAHDIGESLQFALEKLDNVERAFVHLDYESEHKPEHWVHL